MVTVVKALGTEESELIIGLNETDGSNFFRYTNNASQHITIQTCNRHHGNATTADHFVVAVGMDDFPCRSNDNTFSKRTTISPSRMPISRPTPAPTLRFRSERPNPVVQPQIATPVSNMADESSTPSINEVYTIQSSHPSERTHILTQPSTHQATKSTQQMFNMTIPPTEAPQPTRVPVLLKPSVLPAPILNQGSIEYTQSPFPPIRYDGQRQNDTKTVGGKQFSSHVVYIFALVSIFGLLLIAVVLLTIRARKRRIANQQSILPTKT
jgi:hypothetical protein